MIFSEAIYKLYPSAVSTMGETVYDAEGNEVAYDKEALEAYIASQAYLSKRSAEYPPVTDYIDGIVKGDAARVQAYIDACLAVKAKYPKE